MSYTRIKYEKIKKIAEDVFLKLGYSWGDSEIIADVILESDLRGIESHGIQRLLLYYRYVTDGTEGYAGDKSDFRGYSRGTLPFYT